MNFRTIGSLEVSVIGLGCDNFGMTLDAAASKTVVRAAVEAGINFLDTADIYRPSEEWVGDAIAGRRDEVVIATKFGFGVDPARERSCELTVPYPDISSLRSDAD